MRRISALLIGSLMVLALAGAVLAQTQATPPATGAPPAATPPAQPAPPPAAKAPAMKRLNGEVVSVSPDGKSLVVRHTGKRKSKDVTFTVGGDAAGRLADFKPGDHVKVGYVDEQGARVAHSVTRAKRAAKK